MDERAFRKLLELHYTYAGRDEVKAHQIYHEHSVLELPQSGERFVGKEKFLAWRSKYPAKLDFKVRRVQGSGDIWIVEGLISYDETGWKPTIKIMRFEGDKVAHEAVYVMDGFEAPEWRSEWAELFDPLGTLE